MKFAPLFLCLVCVGSNATLFGQCFNDTLRGPYGYLATLGPNTAATPPTTDPAPSTPTFSTTPIGTLLGGIAGNTGTSAGSTLYFDGQGRVFGASTSSFTQNITGTMVGTYDVSADCTVKVSLYDAFTDTATPTSPSNPSLIGLALRGGDELYLAQLKPVATGTTPATGSAALAQRTTIRLVRYSDRYATGCSVSTLRGAYGLIGEGFSKMPTTTGTDTTPPASVAPYYSTFFARVNFDGTGKLTTTTVPTTAPLATFQYRGTYTVNSDCTGTLTITQQPAPAEGTTPTTPVVNTTVKFLITPESGFVDSRGQVVSQIVQNLKPGFVFTISNSDQTMNGVGVPQ